MSKLASAGISIGGGLGVGTYGGPFKAKKKSNLLAKKQSLMPKTNKRRSKLSAVLEDTDSGAISFSGDDDENPGDMEFDEEERDEDIVDAELRKMSEEG